MSVRDRMYELTQVEELEEFMDRFQTSVIFKAGACHKTMQGFGNVEKVLESYPGIHIAFVRVIESRPVSNVIAEITEIKHESPQFILFVDGKAVFDLDNWDITPDALSSGLVKYLGKGESQEKAKSGSDMTEYARILEEFTAEKISEPEFKEQWLKYFQLDATPRSKEEFDLINSLFGDVDQAIQDLQTSSAEGPAALKMTRSTEQSLKSRAKTILLALKSMNS